ncbi:MAG: hypothetical protein JO211_13680, partial [Acidobacteriaceae bacterium]|nr:hypothetical protein [Acidobacteriaceae bacterium]
MFWKKLHEVKLFRTLRFRLAATFLLLLTAVLAVMGFVGTTTLNTVLENQSEDELREQLGALKGWIDFEPDSGNPFWSMDREDPEEEAEVSRLDAVYLVTDETGHVVLPKAPSGPAFDRLADRKTILSELVQMQGTHAPVIKTITGTDKQQYEVISSTMTDPRRGTKWYVAEGRSLQNDRAVSRRFQRTFWILLPMALLACAGVSWYSAGNILTALQSVEKAAQDITGSSLGLQIPKRGADDELDRLIDSFNE